MHPVIVIKAFFCTCNNLDRLVFIGIHLEYHASFVPHMRYISFHHYKNLSDFFTKGHMFLLSFSEMPFSSRQNSGAWPRRSVSLRATRRSGPEHRWHPIPWGSSEGTFFLSPMWSQCLFCCECFWGALRPSRAWGVLRPPCRIHPVWLATRTHPHFLIQVPSCKHCSQDLVPFYVHSLAPGWPRVGHP